MRLFYSALISCLIFQYSSVVYSQSDQKTPITFPDSNLNFIELNGYISNQKNTPFWMQTNQFGIIPKESPALSLHTGLEHYWNISRSTRKVRPFRIGGGVEVAANLSASPKVLLPQLFGALKFRNWELVIGRRKQWVGLADSTLGTGSYIWSGNALPIPKIQFGTSKFVSVPFTSDLIAFNAFYSDGLFENNRPVTSDLKLHQKALYVRLGKATSKLRLYGGFNHQVEWGGKSPYETVNNQMPTGIKNYFYAITGQVQPSGPDLTHFDSTNRIGNHLGTIDLAIQFEIKNSTWFIYRQNIYEDGSLYHLNNVKDGLNGISFRRRVTSKAAFQIRGAVLEVLYTKSQGGSVANLTSTIRGKDNYFNNSQVRDGWSYYDRTIGTPFITPTSDTEWLWPVNSNFFTSNNRVAVIHMGLNGTVLDTISWTGKFSYSQNYGTYDIPFKPAPKQVSAILSVEIPTYFLGGTILRGSLAADIGGLYQKNVGLSIGIKKQGFLGANDFKFKPLRF